MTHETLTAPDDCASLDEVRHAIDHIDRQIVEALGLRFRYIQAATRFKSTSDEAHAADRYAHVLDKRRQWADEAGLDPDLIESIYRRLIDHFIAHEIEMLNARNSSVQCLSVQ